jgi:multiple sugar transport system permease protein
MQKTFFFSKKNTLEAVQITVILIVIFIILIPIFWIISGAFKNQVDLFQLKFFFKPTLNNFLTIFQSPYYIQNKLLNSTIISVLTVLFTLPLAIFSAYSFSRFSIWGGRKMFLLLLATQFIPAVVIVLPFFVLFRDLGFLDTRIALVVVNFTLTMPFAIWMLKSFIDAIPLEVEEAAMVDGSTRWQVIKNIVFPIAMPGIITTAIFCFILSWNEFIFALILTSRDSVTLPVGLSLFQSEEGVLWHLISASGILIMIPMFIFTLIIQKHLIHGMSLGAIK